MKNVNITGIKRIPEAEVYAYARDKAAHVMARNEWRAATTSERRILTAAIGGGILSARARISAEMDASAAWDTIHTAADTAEYMVIHMLHSNVNSFFSVYNPILDWFRLCGIEC